MPLRHEPENSGPTTNEPIETPGETFPSGEIIELVLDRPGGDETRLIFWDGQKAEIASRVEFGGKVFIPIVLNPRILRAVPLPSEPAPFGAARDLFIKLVDLLSAFSTLRSREQGLIAFFIMSSWFSDALSPAPCVLFRGPSRAEVCRLFRLLRSLCRRGITLTELTPEGLCTLPMYLRPTLLIDQMVLTPCLAGLLRPSNQPGMLVARSGTFLDLHSVRAIFVATNHLEPMATQGMLQIPIPAGEGPAATLDAYAADRIAAKFQPYLLDFRLRNHRRVRDSAFDWPDFSTEVREIARGLGAPIAEDPELVTELIDFLGAEEQDARARTTLHPDYAVIFSLLGSVHRALTLKPRPRILRVKELAELVNLVLRANGEILEFTAQEVGYRLRALGLFTRRSPDGQVLRLDRAFSQLVHRLAREYGISVPPGGFPGCPDCQDPSQATEMKMLM